jgi:Skp family chaperone for outer membrane proteins
LALGGCENRPDGGGRVAVLDLERVAKETGYTRQITTQLGGLRTNLQNKLTEVQTQLNTQLTDKQGEFGSKPNEEQRKLLNQLFANAKLQLQQAQQQASDVIQQERSNLISQLRDVLRPYAKRVAGKRGLDVVILKSDTLVFDNSPDSDITDEVIAAVVEAKADLQAAPNATPPVPATSPDNKTEKNPAPQSD